MESRCCVIADRLHVCGMGIQVALLQKWWVCSSWSYFLFKFIPQRMYQSTSTNCHVFIDSDSKISLERYLKHLQQLSSAFQQPGVAFVRRTKHTHTYYIYIQRYNNLHSTKNTLYLTAQTGQLQNVIHLTWGAEALTSWVCTETTTGIAGTRHQDSIGGLAGFGWTEKVRFCQHLDQEIMAIQSNIIPFDEFLLVFH